MSYQDARSAADAYKSSSVENAPGIKVIRMLYEGALRFLDRALALETDDPQFGVWVTRADAVITELRLALDREHAAEGAMAAGVDADLAVAGVHIGTLRHIGTLPRDV